MDPKLVKTLERIESGEYKSACIYELINTYYQFVIGKDDEIDDDVLYWDEPFPEEFSVPVEERSSGIGEALEILLGAGHDINDDDGMFNALMPAVGSGDEHMVHFLLKHGADANRWPEMEENDPAIFGNWYLDQIDSCLLEESLANDKDIEYMKALHRTAVVLAKEAHLGPFNGYCLSIDTENRTVSVKPAEVMY